MSQDLSVQLNPLCCVTHVWHLQDQDIYSIYDNEEFEGHDTTSPSSKDTLIYREVKTPGLHARVTAFLQHRAESRPTLMFYRCVLGPRPSAKQLGELLHGDPDGDRPLGLHHELHHWQEQEQ